MSGVRSELLAYFTHVLLGDALAAEYLILHLISNVYVSPTEPEKPQTDDSRIPVVSRVYSKLQL